ncbi:type 1 fimbrial protein [Pseudomonas syringae group genomosp. 3]|uniref:Type I fimbrial protein FimA n=1 Tax=Pseudomonas syringae pv. persicae TaxID=237306 RepID=A0AB38EGI4_9PSED|nr:type 1 fimbrial protein [Pseudomonas syringae group genomosp. 3]SOQ11248.1 type I fimbrial protein FimA [Pseudomonas syringae pv. persicae]SOQ11253.1 type I fimbrial protein FimA [Pseudomonas syringae pv. persicae]
MKRTLLALPLTLLMGAAAPAFANTGTINFTGNITSATCSIEVVDPITGNPGSGLVNIGSVAASRFCSGLMIPDTHLGENIARYRGV